MLSCPHCGTALRPQRPTLASYRAATDRRAAKDRTELYPLLRQLQESNGGFLLTDIVRALEKIGKRHGQAYSVLDRGVERGWIVLVGSTYTGRRMARKWKLTIAD